MRIGTNGPAVAGEEVHGRAVGPGVEARAERHGRCPPCVASAPAAPGRVQKAAARPGTRLSQLGLARAFSGRVGRSQQALHVGAGTTHQAITAGIDQATLSRRTHGDRNGTRRHRDVASRDT